DTLEPVRGENLRKDYFGAYQPSAGMAYNWRQTFWYAPEKAIYGVHGGSGYLFRFRPQVPRIELLERLTSEPSRRSGMHDSFAYGYLGFALGTDGRTIYYLTTGPAEPIAQSGKRQEDLHLVTYDIPAARYRDHGPI